MAVTITNYNHTPKLLLNKEVTFTTLKAELLSNTATFAATHTAKTSVDNAGAYEVYGNGWVQGGPTLGNVAVTQQAITDATSNDAMLDADDVIITAAGGTIGPAYACLIYDSTTNKPLCYIDFGQVQSAGDTTDFKIRFHANGLIDLTQ